MLQLHVAVKNDNVCHMVNTIINPLTPSVAILVQHPGTLTLSTERQSARMSKITNDVHLNPVWHRMLYS